VGPNSEIPGVLTIHCFCHQSGRGERSGGLGTAKLHVFSARVLWDMSQDALIHNTLNFLGRMEFWDGDDIDLNLDGESWWFLDLPWW
jgi:hypothetical protein